MKILILSFLLLISFSGFNNNEITKQKTFDTKQFQDVDWTNLFPDIPNCKRFIQPIRQNGGVIEQIAIYELESYENNNENSYGCGSISLRYEPSVRDTMRESTKNFIGFPFRKITKISGYDAIQSSPQCGNDPWAGSVVIYFDKDKFITFSAKRGAQAILDFAENADYELMRRSINKFLKNKTGQK